MNQAANDEFTVVSWNVEHNGTDADGSDHRWHLAMDILTGLRPHVLLRQELTRADMYGQRMVWAEARRLGNHTPFLASATRESANPTGVYVDRDLCDPVQFFDHRTLMWHPVCNPLVQLMDAPTPLSLASIHLCSWDPTTRAREAKRLTVLRRPGMEAIFGGDCNSEPHRQDDETAEPTDWSQVEDRALFEARTIEVDGRRVTDTVPDEILAGEYDGQPPVFVDLAHYAATELGQQDALPATAPLWRKDQGPRRRIDRIYATPRVAEALTRVEVIVTDEVIEVSDHAPLLATFSRSKLRRALDRAPGKGAVAA
ncbi:endonuclease/exonuclease/phosphatase family protein [Streptomyces torulosus]|uniref:endonuclease/exonuclease/phosphatase family protein n=1 Tax=Streptomyces torulosus TaxID=68276 RepID=UPI0006EBA0A5|nr:endonuclease/exonuclease/phosphatase family protein [Streptomyces torulosus]